MSDALVLDETNSVPIDGWYELLRAMVKQARRDLTLPVRRRTNNRVTLSRPTAWDKRSAKEFLLDMESTFAGHIGADTTVERSSRWKCRKIA